MRSSQIILLFTVKIAAVAAITAITAITAIPARSAPADSTKTVDLRGSVGASYDLYSMSSTGPTEVGPRRPSSVFRLTADPTISISDWMEIPIRISLTFREASVIQPQLPDPDLASFLQNPLNRISISPRIGWATFHLGSIVPQYGSFTVGNAQIFGVGFDLKPAPLRVSATYGILARPVQVDTSSGRRGSYSRSLLAFRFASEASSRSAIGFTFARMSDDRTSIPFVTESISIPVPIVDSNGVIVRDSAYSVIGRDTLQPLPQEGITMGLDFRSEIGNGGFVGGEVAGTAFTRDIDAPELTDPIPVIDLLMTTRTSTRMDLAGKVEGGYNTRTWGISAGLSYIGPGFVSLTQPFLQPDRIDVTVTPRATLLDGRLSGTATVGWRKNDLIGSLRNGSTQLLLNISATGVVTDAFILSGSFTNFGYRQTRDVDTLRYEQVTTSFSLMPSYSITSDDFRHVINASFAMDAFNDVTSASIPSSSNTTLSATGSYGISPRKGEWSANLMISYVTNDQVAIQTTMKGATVSGRYRLFDGRLTPDAAFTYSSNVIAGLPQETQATLRAGIAWDIITTLQLSARLQFTSVGSDDTARGRNYSEILSTFALRWSF